MSTINCDLIAGGCNTVYNGFDYCQAQFLTLVAYPCSNSVLIYDTKLVRVTQSLSFSSKRVNCVRFFFQLGQTYIVAVSGDGQISIWEYLQEVWTLKSKQKSSSNSIQQVQVVRSQDEKTYFITVDIDGYVRLLDFDLQVRCELFFGKNIMESIDSIGFEENTLIALSGVDEKIYLYELVTVGEIGFHFLTSLKGHQRSVNSLQFQRFKTHLLLASGGKDNYVRLWRIYQNELEQNIDHDNKQGIKVLNLANKSQWKVRLDSILQGHQEEVSSLTWGKDTELVVDESQVYLASASFDYNIIIWRLDKDVGIWLMHNRLGQTSGNKNQFFSVRTNFDSSQILASTFVGAFYLWTKKDKEWIETSTVSGHFSMVSDLDWSSNGSLVTGSLDQTTRLWARWINNNSWNEIARPQIHGYDINAVKFLKNQGNQIETLVSGGDEKIIRLFSANTLTANYLNCLSGSNVKISQKVETTQFKTIIKDQEINVELYKVGCEAVQQPLGLMNKQYDMPGIDDEFGEGLIQQEQVDINLFNDIHYTQPPNDALLTIRGLWSELNKMYGHGYEIIALATYENLTASSCKGNSQEASRIIIWDTKNYKILQQLTSHSYTVVQIQFSRTGKYIASVSKDRCLSLFGRDEQGLYQLIEKSQPCSRIIYTCAFSEDESFILTGSRDKRIRLYLCQGLQKVYEHTVGQPVSAIDLIKCEDFYTVITGLESGEIVMYQLKIEGKQVEMKETLRVPQQFQHNAQINRIKINSIVGKSILFASCSDDFTVRVFSLNLL